MLRTAYFQRFLSIFLTLVFISPDALALTYTIVDPGTFVRVEDVKHIAHLEGLPVGWKDEHTAYLGLSSNDALGNPTDDVFEF